MHKIMQIQVTSFTFTLNITVWKNKFLVTLTMSWLFMPISIALKLLIAWDSHSEFLTKALKLHLHDFVQFWFLADQPDVTNKSYW